MMHPHSRYYYRTMIQPIVADVEFQVPPGWEVFQVSREQSETGVYNWIMLLRKDGYNPSHPRIMPL